MALENSGFFRNPRNRESRRDRGIGYAQLLRRFRRITRARHQAERYKNF